MCGVRVVLCRLTRLGVGDATSGCAEQDGEQVRDGPLRHI